MSLEELVLAYPKQPMGRTAKVVRCETTGETGTIRHFAERIAAVRKTQFSTEKAKLHRAVLLGTTYRNLIFTEIPRLK